MLFPIHDYPFFSLYTVHKQTPQLLAMTKSITLRLGKFLHTVKERHSKLFVAIPQIFISEIWGYKSPAR